MTTNQMVTAADSWDPTSTIWRTGWVESEVAEEFRANNGVVPRFGQSPLLLLTTTGAKTGLARTCPMTYQVHDDHVYVFASKAGFPTHPHWFLNLRANPEVTVEIGTDRYQAAARILPEDQRRVVFERQTQIQPIFIEYQARTSRSIPIVELVRSH